MIEKKTKGAFYHNLKHTKDEEKTTIFLGGGSVHECIPLITSNLGLKLMAMDSYRDKSFCNAEIPQKIPRITRRFRLNLTLGIPVTIASDPRHVSYDNPGAGLLTEAFSKWPTPLGMAAARDTALVKEFGDIARQEYLAVGIRLALHPMADLATEPRWGRINGTFGEDATLSAQMTKAYVLVFQGDTLDSESVACMTKHFPGGGPQKDGEDAHFAYGKDQVYPGANFDYHLLPFEQGAFPARTAQIMPYYGIPVGQTNKDVAFAFNKEIISGLLRDQYGFDGVVCTDWNLVTRGPLGEPRSWGVEALTDLEKTKMILDAGCDQFGGEASPELVIELVRTGQIPESRINQSVKRILRDKFRLGLFDNPYVDEKAANLIAGNEAFARKGKEAQRKSVVLLKNENLQGNPILPLPASIKIFVRDVDSDIASGYAEVVSTPEDADFNIVRLYTPYEPRDEYFLERFFRQGRLHYTAEEMQSVFSLCQLKPTIVVVNLERPAILTTIAKEAQGLLIDFGVEDDALLDVIFGKFNPIGKLPFELPSSVEALEGQLEDVPYDSEDPLFLYGFGLSYD